MHDQQNSPTWRGPVPISPRFDDPYYSLENGLEETRYVFLDGNDLPERFFPGFHIAELGFGTGLNLLAALDLWRSSGQSGKLHFTSFEAFPLSPDDMIAAQAGFPELAGLAEELAPFWPRAAQGFETDDLVFHMMTGDARETLPHWEGCVHAWFLDGFSPAKNPELWDDTLLSQVAARLAPGGTAATYTAAGHVRRALEQAGLCVARRAGYGRKRHMTQARRPADD